ncbi:MAG: ABC transporter ATP-binding protein [Bacteroidetes bacterium B1(2017)]|nr:MAG: ABC transporter ATP-binding protein [Bacteroidetes bacterium B1(2017)]
MIIEINSLNKSYQNHIALKNISLGIKKGSIFGLLGPNGAGKTSLIRILTHITEADSGTILFNGNPLQENHIYKMGYLPEERGLYKKMTVKDQLLYFAELKGLSNSMAKEKLKYWVDKFEIKNWLGKKVEELSKGMQQKVQFIATVLHEPELIILDEPFSGFDPINAQLLVDEILQLKQNGATIIFSTHRMDSVELLCDHIALINKAEKILDGEVNTIKQQFKKNQFALTYSGQRLLSDSFINVSKEESKNGETNCLLELNSIASNNDLIAHLLNQQISIHSFGESLPSMEEIFIQAVQQKSQSL